MPRTLSHRNDGGRLSRLILSLVSLGLIALAAGLTDFARPTANAAATFTVNSTGDAADSNTADGLCNDGSGNCTLRAAIQQANAAPGPDVINFSVTGTVNLTGPLPDIASDMTVNGPGSGQLTVRRNAGGDYRIFKINGGTVTLSGMTITNGQAAAGADSTAGQGGDGESGGGVYNDSQAALTLSNCVVSNNTAGRGGNSPTTQNVFGGKGGLGGGVFNRGSLVMTACTVTGNRSGQGGAGRWGGWGGTGGGLANDGAGTLTVTSCVFSDNVTGNGGAGNGASASGGIGGDGGGLDSDGQAIVSDSTFSGNVTGDGGPNGGGGWGGGRGGGIHLGAGSMTLTNSTVSGNRTGRGVAPAGPSGAGGDGGGIYNSAALIVTRSTVSSNQTGGGTGSAAAGAGAGLVNAGTLTLVNSAVSGNVTGTDGGGVGGQAGGIYNFKTLTINGSTVSGNTGGVGGAMVNEGTLSLTNSTVSGNHLSGGLLAGAVKDASTSARMRVINCTIVLNDGPGLHAAPADNFHENSPVVGNTILAANNGNVADTVGLFVSLGHNFVSKNGGGNGFANGNKGDQVGTLESPIDARLRPLDDNGGPTLTHAPLAGSPVLDAGDNAVALGPDGNPLTTDQRGAGFPRFADWADADSTQTVDIGAFETHPFIEDVTDKTTNEDTPLSFSFNVGDAALGISSVTAASSNQSLVPDSNLSVTGTGPTRTLQIAPLANAFATTTITLTVTAANGRTAQDTFLLTVNSANDAPSFTKGADQSVPENSGAQTVVGWATGISPGPPDESNQSLAFQVTGNTNPGLFSAAPAVSANGTLSYTPAAHATGSATITLVLKDNGGTAGGGQDTSAPQTFNINVLPGGSVQFSAAAFEAVEGGQPTTIKVTRAGGGAGAASVSFATSGGTAAAGASCGAGADYVSASGTLSWADGDTADKTITVTLCDNLSNEPDETFGVTLSGAAGSASLGTPSSATVNIRDDDPAGGRVEFSQATYTAGESSGVLTVTVRRVGDTARAVSVDYATDDGSVPGVAMPCSSTTGLALHRCDFTKAAGQLLFAADETEKTFQVLLSDDSYTEGTETATLRLSAPGGGAALGERATATLEITDDAHEPAANTIDDERKFVRQHYHDFLNREPDADGLNFWTNEIAQCGSDAQCREVKRNNVSAAFFLSIEFQQTGYLVERIYKAAFGEATGTSTLNGPHQLQVPVIRLEEFLPDTQRIGLGVVVNQGDWKAQLEANKQAFALEFVRRPRFTAAFPETLTPAQFVNQLNTRAGGPLDADERKALVDELSANNTAAGRASVLRKVAEDKTLERAETNKAFVLMQYFGYLGRNPDDVPDRDFTGYDFWLNKLDQFNGDYIRAEMVKAFLDSIEYRKRFGQ